MTPEALRAARAQLGLSAAGLAQALRLGKGGDRTVRRWEAGERSIPGPVEVAIEMMLERLIDPASTDPVKGASTSP